MLGHLAPYKGDAQQPVQQCQVQSGHAGHVYHRASKEAPGSGHGRAVCLFSIGSKSQSKQQPFRAKQQSQRSIPKQLLGLCSPISILQPAGHCLTESHQLTSLKEDLLGPGQHQPHLLGQVGGHHLSCISENQRSGNAVHHVTTYLIKSLSVLITPNSQDCQDQRSGDRTHQPAQMFVQLIHGAEFLPVLHLRLPLQNDRIILLF